MKRYLLAASLAIIGASGFAQLTWTTATQSLVPIVARVQMHGSAVATVGPKKFLYVIGGNVSASAPGIVASGDSPYIYFAEILSTGTLSAWTTCTATLPVHPTDSAEPSMAYISRAVDSYNGKIYVMGGNNNGAPPERTDMQILTPSANGDILLAGVTTVTPTGSYVARFEKTMIINQATGKMYVIGGGSPTRVNNVDVAQINGSGAVGAFAATSPLLTAVGQAPAVIKNNRLYVTGGYNGSASVPDIQYATINGDGTLAAFAATSIPLPEGLFDGDAVANPNRNDIYVIGGAQAGNTTTRKAVYRVALNSGTGNTDSVALDSNLPTEPGLGLRRMGAVTDGISIYVPGGRQDGSNLTAETYTSVLPLPVPVVASADQWTMFE